MEVPGLVERFREEEKLRNSAFYIIIKFVMLNKVLAIINVSDFRLSIPHSKNPAFRLPTSLRCLHHNNRNIIVLGSVAGKFVYVVFDLFQQ